MRTIGVSEFKTEGLALLDEVQKTGEPVMVTRHGKPVAKIVPMPAAEMEPRKNEPRKILGYMKGTGRIVGDIVSPAADLEDWEVLQS